VFRRHQLRPLGPGDAADLLALCERDPVTDVFVASRVERYGIDRPGSRGGELLGWFSRGELVSACWFGANLVPVQAVPEALHAFTQHALQTGRRCSSLVGPADEVLGMWSELERRWGPAREVRADQPLMAIAGPAAVAPDPRVRRARPDDLPLLVPAAVAMFTEEVGYSPVAYDGGHAYRQRVAQLVDDGCAFVRIEPLEGAEQVVFKADLGALSSRVAQVQGVYVDPRLRGRGLAAPGMAAVVDLARAAGVGTVSLYANAWNVPALAAYRRVGFDQVGTFATVLF
jgi:predicted GNAT family acetyltransferase